MKTSDFSLPLNSVKLRENLEKQFGTRVNLENYDRVELEDIRNKLRTRIFQQESSAKINELLTNEAYQKDKAMLELLNTKIKEMLGEAKKSEKKPDWLLAAQLKAEKKAGKIEEDNEVPIGVRSLYTKMYAKHGGTAAKAKSAEAKAYAEVEKKYGKEMADKLKAYHKSNVTEEFANTCKCKACGKSFKVEKNGVKLSDCGQHKGLRAIKVMAESVYTTEKQILTRIRQIMHDRKLSGTESNAGELHRLKQQLKNMRSNQDDEFSKQNMTENEITGPKVHDFSHMSDGDIYDQTQWDDTIRDGDVLIGSKGAGILVDAWPVVVTGHMEEFHKLSPDISWEEFEDGKYAKSAELAQSQAKGSSNLNENDIEDDKLYVVNTKTNEIVSGPYDNAGEIPLRLMGYDGGHKVLSGGELKVMDEDLQDRVTASQRRLPTGQLASDGETALARKKKDQEAQAAAQQKTLSRPTKFKEESQDHPDKEQDQALIRAMVKPDCMKKEELAEMNNDNDTMDLYIKNPDFGHPDDIFEEQMVDIVVHYYVDRYAPGYESGVHVETVEYGDPETGDIREVDFSKLSLSMQDQIETEVVRNLERQRDSYGEYEESMQVQPNKEYNMKESKKAFKQNVKMVNEAINYLLAEDKEEEAKTITAAGDMVNDFTSWANRLGQYQTKVMIDLSDAIKKEFGAQKAEEFKQTVEPALSSALEVLTHQREIISNAVAVLAGSASADSMIGAEPPMTGDEDDMSGMQEPPMEPSDADQMNEPEDEFSTAATGREMRESNYDRKLRESHSILSKLASR